MKDLLIYPSFTISEIVPELVALGFIKFLVNYDLNNNPSNHQGSQSLIVPFFTELILYL
jgi:hypothetical protein